MMGFTNSRAIPGGAGSGVWWLIARRESRLVDLSWLHAIPTLIDVWTHAIVLFELAFPILVWNRLARPLLLALAVVIWTSLALITGDITFAVTLMIAAMAFVPPETVRTAADRLSWPKRDALKPVATAPAGRHNGGVAGPQIDQSRPGCVGRNPCPFV